MASVWGKFHSGVVWTKRAAAAVATCAVAGIAVAGCAAPEPTPPSAMSDYASHEATISKTFNWPGPEANGDTQTQLAATIDRVVSNLARANPQAEIAKVEISFIVQPDDQSVLAVQTQGSIATEEDTGKLATQTTIAAAEFTNDAMLRPGRFTITAAVL